MSMLAWAFFMCRIIFPILHYYSTDRLIQKQLPNLFIINNYMSQLLNITEQLLFARNS